MVFVSESSKVTMCGVALRRGESDCSDEVFFLRHRRNGNSFECVGDVHVD